MANCDQAEEVGEKIQKSLDGVAVTSAKIKKSDHVKTLQYLQTGIQVNKNNIHIEPFHALYVLHCDCSTTV